MAARPLEFLISHQHIHQERATRDKFARWFRRLHRKNRSDATVRLSADRDDEPAAGSRVPLATCGRCCFIPENCGEVYVRCVPARPRHRLPVPSSEDSYRMVALSWLALPKEGDGPDDTGRTRVRRGKPPTDGPTREYGRVK